MRKLLPKFRLTQVTHVDGNASVDAALWGVPLVDALLLDPGKQNLPVKELGGTGSADDWRVSQRIREEAGIPLFLAGCLKAGNVSAAIGQVQPHRLDLCSSVRTGGDLEGVKLNSFMDKVVGRGP